MGGMMEKKMIEPILRRAQEPNVLDRLSGLCEERGLGVLARRLVGLSELVAGDLALLEDELDQVRADERLTERAGSYLLERGGKRIRPLCVALASRVGAGFARPALDLAVAVELVHNATLLHDDVIDVAPTRRGKATAWTEFGNAASIFAGDWLLIEALQRVQRAGIDGALDRLLDTIARMIRAESLQLENRGRLETDRNLYMEIAQGKSATLFQWAMFAGACAGGLGPGASRALERYGSHVGVAFQVIDDLLDLTGEVEDTGKALFTDLREGKMTYPVILARELCPELDPLLREVVALELAAEVPASMGREIQRLLHASGAVEQSRALASERVRSAVAELAHVPPGEATTALGMVAEAIVHRSH
jgi:octaprenyl-diphosphate synthase